VFDDFDEFATASNFAREHQMSELRSQLQGILNWLETGEVATEGPATSPEAVRYTRKNLHDLTSTERTALRRAFEAVNTTSNPVWGRFVMLHQICARTVHGAIRFLPWHRLMVWRFEQAMRNASSTSVSIPYWTWWQPQTSGRKGIPPFWVDFTPAIRFPTLRPASRALQSMLDGLSTPAARLALGVTERELATRIAGSVLGPDGTNLSGGSLRVTRTTAAVLRSGGPSQNASLPTRDQVRTVLAIRDFSSFWRALERVHGGPHVWAGDSGDDFGAMGRIAYSPADCLFYFHHAEVDRLWHLRQLTFGRNTSWPLTGAELPPWPERVADVLDITGALGFDYASRSVDDPR
jgi:hypothetical protein